MMQKNTRHIRLKSALRALSTVGTFIFIVLLIYSCTDKIPKSSNLDFLPDIEPDYSSITIPLNIAPLNFLINEKADKFLVRIDSRLGYAISTEPEAGKVEISIKEWRKLLELSKGKDIYIDVYAKRGGQWFKFKSITNHVSEDSIDNHLVYRLLTPGFESWHEMGIYQRDLENFEEDPIMVSELSDKSCMNCHTFCNNNSSEMILHMRGKLGGTLIYRNGKTSFINTKTQQTISPAVYPAWQPNGRYIAFSVNQIVQQFHAIPDKKIEVIDTASDIILFDSESNTVLKCPKIATAKSFETFPTWSPDGRYLYFCSAKALPQENYDHIRYDLLKIAFNPATLQFGESDTVFSASRNGKSVSFPRISPDGKFLLFCLSDYGNFSIWHKESDLYLLNLATREITKPEINSDQSESFHDWSSNGKWIVFSSRRSNGLFTRIYLTHFKNNEGKAEKPFILPQKSPDFYLGFMKSYNIPELVKSKIKLNPREISEIIRTKPVNATEKTLN